MKEKIIFILIGVLSAFLVLGGTFAIIISTNNNGTTKSVSVDKSKGKKGDKVDVDGTTYAGSGKESNRKVLLRNSVLDVNLDYTPNVQSYTVASDLSNVINADRFYFNDEKKALLSKNYFYVENYNMDEFFDVYEQNRYGQIPSFITTDSMMHTYHLYFAKLQKKTEKNYLINEMCELTKSMYDESIKQYEALKGTDYEKSAAINVVYFAVAAKLLDIDESVPSELQDTFTYEVNKIYSCSGIDASALFIEDNYNEDYSQYKPRGYYEGDVELEKYFRAMMWYGRMNFSQNSEIANKSALLMNLALKGDAEVRWENIYTTTAFFAGESDDLGFYEYGAIIKDIYGDNVDISSLPENESAYENYKKAISKLDPPTINSVVFADDGGETDKLEEAKGFRFMGQRFSVDEAIFTQLCYSKTLENSNGDKRMLPDALDVPAVLGSKEAENMLKENGAFEYKNYEENYNAMKEKISEAPKEIWSSSLYGQWMYTLEPLLTERGEGYPSYMTTEAWRKKSVECYLGSWTELKHDTVLYSKQMMAEMGDGGDDTVYDDRGYVETNPELFARLEMLSSCTCEGLEARGMIDEADKEDMMLMSQIAGRLKEISIKELTGETVTEEDYEFIRCYGGNLEHFWKKSITEDESEYVNPQEYPAAVVVDVATDPNGHVLEEGVGGASRIYVVVPVEGSLRVATGTVYNYYQFTVPISQRMTDSDWRIKLGMEVTDNYEYMRDDSIVQPDWTQEYRYQYNYSY